MTVCVTEEKPKIDQLKNKFHRLQDTFKGYLINKKKTGSGREDIPHLKQFLRDFE